MKTLCVQIHGMHCDGCMQSVRSALAETAGVDSSEVTLQEAVVSYDDARCGVSDVLSAIRAAGSFEVTGFSHAGE